MSEADLTEVSFAGTDLRLAKCAKLTTWPGDFDPIAAGVIRLVE